MLLLGNSPALLCVLISSVKQISNLFIWYQIMTSWKETIYNGSNTSRSLNFRLFQIHGMFGADSCMIRNMTKHIIFIDPYKYLKTNIGKIFKKASCWSSHRSNFKGLMSKSDKQHVNKMYSALGTLKYYLYSYFFSSG